MDEDEKSSGSDQDASKDHYQDRHVIQKKLQEILRYWFIRSIVDC